MRPRKDRCRHQWDKWLYKRVGPATDFNGEQCEVWECDACGDTRTVFIGVAEKLGWGGIGGNDER